jgi:toxin ParE1/3/4
MKKISFSPAARDDLMDIAVFIAQDNPTRALTFVDEIENRCGGLGRSPGIGTARPELGEGVCMLPHGRYLIFYRAAGDAVRIERIMHSARDVGDEDFEAPPGEESD